MKRSGKKQDFNINTREFFSIAWAFLVAGFWENQILYSQQNQKQRPVDQKRKGNYP